MEAKKFYLKMRDITVPFEPTIRIESIYTIYYFEFTKEYRFIGEKHPFWEMVFIDRGALEVSAEHRNHKLQEGDIIFHKPNEFHTLHGNGIDVSNVLVITFECNSNQMSFFENKILKIHHGERALLASILKEAKNVFGDNLGNIFLQEQHRSPLYIGAEQMMYLHLEEFLLRLIRDETIGINKKRIKRDSKKQYEKGLVEEIINYLNKNIHKKLTLVEICEQFHISNTHLKNIFKQETGLTVKRFFGQLKVEKAKQYIREGKVNFTEIASALGFESIHYFSTFFKNETGLSPSEYACSILAMEKKLMMENSNLEESSLGVFLNK